MNEISLKQFIDDHGEGECAKLWGVKERTVASWRRGERKPRPAKAEQMIRLSEGTLSYVSIYSADFNGISDAQDKAA